MVDRYPEVLKTANIALSNSKKFLLDSVLPILFLEWCAPLGLSGAPLG